METTSKTQICSVIASVNNAQKSPKVIVLEKKQSMFFIQNVQQFISCAASRKKDLI